MSHYSENIIIGAGAAGLFCAAQLGKLGKQATIFDNGKKIGRKILMSGGGFCNFTNMEISPDRYISQNKHFVKSALTRYTHWDFIALVAEYGIPYHEKELGQLFCDKVRFKLKVNAVEWQCQNLIIATGGLSMPGLGASPFGYQIAEQFGLNVIPPRASLVPFTWRESEKFYTALSGISLDVAATNQHKTFTHQMLFTHRGLSGPAILQISNYWQPGESIHLDLLPYNDIRHHLDEMRQSSPKLQLKTVLSRLLPKKLVELWLEQGLIQDEVIANLSKVRLENLENLIHNWQFIPNGTEGYRTAEVTMGGVDTHEISSKTMEATKIKGLYFIGEVLDVVGWLGGYNFQWAWSSAAVCAMGIAES